MKISLVSDNVKATPLQVKDVEELARFIVKYPYSLGVFKNNYRNKDNFASCECLALDIDDGMSLTEARLKFAKYKHIIATTRNHGKDKNGVVAERFRVILFLSHTITDANDYEATWFKVRELCPHADDACKDASRFFYKSVEIISIKTDGDLIEPVKAEKKAETTVLPVATGKKGKLSNAVLRFLDSGAPTGHRHRALHNACIEFKQNGYTEAEFIPRLEHMIRIGGSWETDHVNSKDLKTIADVFNNRQPKHAPRIEETAFSPMSIAEVLEKKIEVTWVVDKLLTEGGFSLIAGAPKCGKSTLARQLAKSISRGEPFLGREVKQGKVLYLALEEQFDVLVEQFNTLGLDKHDNIMIHVGAPNTANSFEDLGRLLEEHKPRLVVIDTLFLFAPVESVNSYSEVNTYMKRMRTLARDSGAHVLAVHHANKPNKDGTRSGANAILGSTAIHGGVDNAMIIEAVGTERIFTTSARYGNNYVNRELLFDEDTATFLLGASKDDF